VCVVFEPLVMHFVLHFNLSQTKNRHSQQTSFCKSQTKMDALITKGQAYKSIYLFF